MTESAPPRFNQPLNRDEYLDTWSGLHGGVPPTGLVGGWLRISFALARPLVARGVPADLITGFGVLLALLVLPSAAGGGHWPLLAVPTIVLAALMDGVDGAVAVVSGRVSRRGAVLDGVCDRLADLCFVGALWLAGAPAGWCVAGGAIALLHEQLRAGARVAGMSDVGVITVSERPTRVILTATFLLGAGLYPGSGATWAAAGASAWTVIGIIGFAQLAVTTARRLT
jgi:phosphatidylglycerophosphate synthase